MKRVGIFLLAVVMLFSLCACGGAEVKPSANPGSSAEPNSSVEPSNSAEPTSNLEISPSVEPQPSAEPEPSTEPKPNLEDILAELEEEIFKGISVQVRSQEELDSLVEYEDAEQITYVDLAWVSDLSPLCALTSLKGINLYCPEIRALDTLSQLTNLVYLKVHVRNMDLSALSELTNLVYLDVSSNGIVDLSALSELTNLMYLDVSNNGIENLSTLPELTNLIHLDVSMNNIEDLSTLPELTNLMHLDVSMNNIEDLSTLSELTNLMHLDVSNNDIVDLSALSELTNLIYLNASCNDIMDLNALSKLTNLTNLTLEENTIFDLSPLSQLTNLAELNLAKNYFSDISPLAGLNKLRTLDLRFNAIEDISPLNQLKKLTELYYSANYQPLEDKLMGDIGIINVDGEEWYALYGETGALVWQDVEATFDESAHFRSAFVRDDVMIGTTDGSNTPADKGWDATRCSEIRRWRGWERFEPRHIGEDVFLVQLALEDSYYYDDYYYLNAITGMAMNEEEISNCSDFEDDGGDRFERYTDFHDGYAVGIYCDKYSNGKKAYALAVIDREFNVTISDETGPYIRTYGDNVIGMYSDGLIYCNGVFYDLDFNPVLDISGKDWGNVYGKVNIYAPFFKDGVCTMITEKNGKYWWFKIDKSGEMLTPVEEFDLNLLNY